MDIIINDKKTLEEIQKEFSSHFSNLKLEFFKKNHEEGEGNKKKDLLELHKTLGEVRKNNKAGNISINGHKKVSTLEEEFFEYYGLNVQVFRKSGKIWLQTTTTDHWTLSEQNKETADAF